jgi:hypothetical protein
MPSSDVPLKREDYPSVKFWFRQDWLARVKEAGNSTDLGEGAVRGKSLMSKGVNKNAKYIEDTDGNPVDGYRLRDIRAHAWEIWANFQTVGRSPPSWGRADAEVARHYRREMRLKFSEFALCENDWKADQLATDNYPSWYSNHVKANDIKEETTDSAMLSGSKRSLSTEPSKLDQFKKAKKVTFLFLDIWNRVKICSIDSKSLA